MTEDEEVHVFLDPLLPLIQKFEFEFNDPWVLREALTHRSFCNEYEGEREMRHKERLELLGDAVIGLIVKEELLYEFREAAEGDITRIYSHLTSNEHLGRIALQHGLGEYMLMSRGEHRAGLKNSPQINAELLEALIGAIYVDQGLKAAAFYVNVLILKYVRKLINTELRGPIEQLMHLLQGSLKITPRYETEFVGGDNPSRSWKAVVWANERELARGEGSSKKAARNAAAKEALAVHYPKQRSSCITS